MARGTINSENGGIANITDLLDVPDSYTDNSGKFLVVNGTETGVVFADTAIPDYVGNAGKAVIINGTETGLDTIALGNASSILSVPISIPNLIGKDGYVLAYNEATGTFYLKLDEGGGGGTSPYSVKTVKPLAVSLYALTAAIYSEANPLAAAFQMLPVANQYANSTIAVPV